MTWSDAAVKAACESRVVTREDYDGILYRVSYEALVYRAANQATFGDSDKLNAEWRRDIARFEAETREALTRAWKAQNGAKS